MPTESPDLLNGTRILIVEDDPMLAFVFKMFFEECGAHVVGPANSLQAAFRFLEARDFDLAVMDVRLNKETVFSLAQYMQDAGIPFAFVTGNSVKTLPSEFQDKPILLKPVNFQQLLSVILNIKNPVHTGNPRSSHSQIPAR